MRKQTAEALFDEEEYSRWIRQAEHTLASAQRDAEAEDHAWACFKAQQAAEYALKALLRGFGLPAIGHSTLRLAREVTAQGLLKPKMMERWARRLARHYIPPRTPDADPAGSTFELYDHEPSQQALKAAQATIQTVRQMRARYG